MSEAATVPQPTDELTQRVDDLPARAEALSITDDASFEAAAEFLLGVKELLAEVSATFDPIVSKANATHKEACAQRTRHQAPLTRAESIVKGAIATYTQEQERIARVAQAEAEKKAREEEEAARLEEAAALEAAGDSEGAEAVLEEEPPPPPPPPVRATPKVAGVSTREVWSAQVTDKAELVKAVAAGTVPLAALEPNMKVLNAQAKALKKEFRYPGVRAVCDKNVAAGRR